MVLRIMRRFNPRDTIENGRRPLIGFTTNKTIELVKAGMGLPAIIGARNGNFPGWRFMIFAKGCGAITVLAEHFSQGRYAIGTNTRIAGKGSSQFHDGSCIVNMVVTTAFTRLPFARQHARHCLPVVTTMLT